MYTLNMLTVQVHNVLNLYYHAAVLFLIAALSIIVLTYHHLHC